MKMSASSLLGLDQSSQMSQSSSRSDWFTEKDLHVGGKCTSVSFYAVFILHIIIITSDKEGGNVLG